MVLDALFWSEPYLHHSLDVRAVKALAMLGTSADPTLHRLIKYSLHINSNELTVTRKLYMTLHHPKLHPHTKSGIPTSNNMRYALNIILKSKN